MSHSKYLDILSFRYKQVKVIFESVFYEAFFHLGNSTNRVFKDRWGGGGGTEGIFSFEQETGNSERKVSRTL